MNSTGLEVFEASPDNVINDPALTWSVFIRETLQPLPEKSTEAAVGLSCQPPRLAEFRRRQGDRNRSRGSHSVRAGYDWILPTLIIPEVTLLRAL